MERQRWGESVGEERMPIVHRYSDGERGASGTVGHRSFFLASLAKQRKGGARTTYQKKGPPFPLLFKCEEEEAF